MTMCEKIDLEPKPIDPELTFTIGLRVEWDDEKDQGNRCNHGYLLASVIDWVSRTLLPITGAPPPTVWLEQVGRDDGEPRYRMLSVDWEGHVVDFVFTMREDEDGQVLRIITYHRADKALIKIFQSLWSATDVKAWLREAYPPKSEKRKD